MGRGKDKVITGDDLKNMSPQEVNGVINAVKMPNVKVRGAAVVRKKDGNAKYDDPSKAGTYHEDNL